MLFKLETAQIFVPDGPDWLKDICPAIQGKLCLVEQRRAEDARVCKSKIMVGGVTLAAAGERQR